MKHLIFLLYILSLISGLLWIIFLAGKLKKVNIGVVGSFLRFFISYTVLLICTTFMTYIIINLNYRQYFLNISSAMIIFCTGPLIYFQAEYNFHLYQWKFSGRMRILLLLPWLISPASILIILLVNLKWLIAVVIIFQVMGIIAVPVYIYIRSFRQYNKVYADNNPRIVMISESIIFIILAVLEIIFRMQAIIETGLIIIIPFAYLFVNILHYLKRRSLMPFLYKGFSKYRFRLTDKEVEIIELIKQGQSNKEIAYNMSISSSTVKNHIYSIFQKTGSQNRIEMLKKIQEY